MILKNLVRPVWIAYSVFLLILVISLAYGFQYRFQVGDNLESLAPYFRLVAIPFLLILVFLSWFSLNYWKAFEQETVILPDLAGLVMMSISLSTTIFFYSNYSKPLVSVIIAAVISIVSFLHFKWSYRVSTLGSFVITLIFYISLVHSTPHEQGANMLEVIEAASREFLSGHDPYQSYESIGRIIYLPALWLPYAAMVWLGVDLRILNFLCLLTILLIFERGLDLGERAPRVLAVTIYPIIFSPPMAQMIIHGHIWPYWVFLLLTALFLYQNRYFAAAIFLGLALAARQPALFLIGPLAVYLYKRIGVLKLVQYGSISVFVYLILLVPFSVWTYGNIWSHWYLPLSSATSLTWANDYTLHQISASNYFYWLNWQFLLKYLQMGILIFCMTFIWNQAKPEKFGISFALFFTGLAYVWFIAFNSYVARYLYFPGIFLMMFALSIWLGQCNYTVSSDTCDRN